MRGAVTAFAAYLLLCLGGVGAHAAPAAPRVLVVVACKVDDLTGKPGRHGVDERGNYDATKAAGGWRDLELHLNKGLEYECKREAVPLEDAITLYWPPKIAPPLNADFSKLGQCVRVAATIAHPWNEANKGWAVVGIGCPTMIGVDADGDGQPDMDEHGEYIVKDWKLPDCPTYLPGTTNRMKCRFDASRI